MPDKAHFQYERNALVLSGAGESGNENELADDLAVTHPLQRVW
jgi:hypothetical protein